MGKTLTFIFTVICAVALVGCNGEAPQEVIDAIPIIVVDDSTYQAYLIIVGDSLSVITQMEGNIEGDILHLIVTFLGGCEEQQFELIASGGIAKSLPPYGFALLINSGPADTCQAETRTSLDFDLTPYREHLQSSGLLESGKIYLVLNEGLAQYEYHF